MKPDLVTLLDLVVEKAKALREAGVIELEIPHVLRIELDPHADAQPTAPARGVVEIDLFDNSDPLNDPTTYGRSDGRVPGFQMPSAAEDND